MKFRTRVVSLALLTSLLLGLMAQPAMAADEPGAEPVPTGHELACSGEDCTLHIDFGAWQMPLLWRYGAPMLVDSMQKNGQLPAGTTLDIADDLTLALPMGDLQLLDANLKVQLDENKSIESFRGTARVPFPSLGVADTFKVADPLRADIGFDYGANLTEIDAPLEPDARYFFFDFGSGIRLDGTLTGADGSQQQLTISTPAGQRAVLVIDPLRPLVYLQGHMTVSYTGSLAAVDTMLAANGVDLPGFDFAAVPGRASLGVTALLTDDPELSYLEVSAGSAIDGGSIARWAGVDLTPIAIDGVARVDHTGMRVTGATRSSLLPETVWDGRGQVQVFIPFDGKLSSAYVDANGAIALPIVALNAQGSSRLAAPAEITEAVTAQQSPGPATSTSDAAADGSSNLSVGDAAAWAGSAMGTGAGAAWRATVDAGQSLGSQAASGAASAWQGTLCTLSFGRAGCSETEAVASR